MTMTPSPYVNPLTIEDALIIGGLWLIGIGIWQGYRMFKGQGLGIS